MKAYRKIEVQQAKAANTDPIYSKPCNAKHGVKVLSAYLVDVSTNIGTSVEFGIETGSIMVPLKVTGAVTKNVPIPILDPFILDYGDRLYAILTTVTLADTIVFAIFGEYLDVGIEEMMRGH